MGSVSAVCAYFSQRHTTLTPFAATHSTPLFVSLLRCLAWAQGLAHQSLTPTEMLYFTLGYDWLLFRHRLADRMSKREEVLYFAFFFLSFAALDDTLCYSCAPSPSARRERLLQLSALFQKVWFRSCGGRTQTNTVTPY